VRDDGRILRAFAGGALIYEHELVSGRGERIRRREIVAPALERNAPLVPQRSLDVYDELAG